MSSDLETERLLDHFSRHDFGRVLSHLTHRFGPSLLEQAEDALQESMYKAMKIWPNQGVPQVPAAWIVRTAQNMMLDSIRRAQGFQQKHSVEWKSQQTDVLEEVKLEEELSDDLLRMMFACCHPDLKVEVQIVLSLKILCGFSNREVARALLKKEEAVAKQYTRAKEQLKKLNIELEVPLGAHLSDRLDDVLKVIYLLFNEGYTASDGERLVKLEICEEAMRLAHLLLEHPLLSKAQVHGLMALMLFQSSRFDARDDKDGNLLTLEEQDRNLWNKEAIELGHQYLNKATAFGQIHDYILQAAMAGIHASAPTFAETNWPQLLALYDALVLRTSNPIVKLNRAVVVQRVHGPFTALKELQQLEEDNRMSQYYLFHAIVADAYKALGENGAAVQSLEKAMSLTGNAAERDFLTKKLATL